MQLTVHFESHYPGSKPLCIITVGSSNQFAGRGDTRKEAMREATDLLMKSGLLKPDQVELLANKLIEAEKRP